MNIRVGLPLKAAAVLIVVVVSAAVLGGWASSHLIDAWMTQSQSEEAGRLANTLRLMAVDSLESHDVAALHRTADEFLHYENVLAVSILDADGRQLAFAGQGATTSPQAEASAVDSPSLGLAYTHAVSRERLLAGRPVAVTTDQGGRIVGAVRIAIDTQKAADRLGQAQMTMGLVICGFVLCFLPLSGLLVSRLLIRPIRRLAQATGKLADGDYSARADADGTDEIGFLAQSFNTMAAKIEVQHAQLRQANENLEGQVRERTAELNAANAKLRADMAEREEFLRAVSHDLNAPLRNIAGMASMILLKWSEQLPGPVIARLERIGANVEAETGLINDLLELSRIGAKPSRPEHVDLADLLDGVRSSFAFDLQQKKIDLRIGAMPELYIERNHIRQVLMNLVDNAIKYMGDGDDSRIEVTCDSDDGMYVFHVGDNGVGISPDDHQRIFTVFRRARDAAANASGKGVGLASVSAIACKYEGRAWVESELGTGSTFHVSFSRKCCEPPREEMPRDDTHPQNKCVAGHLVG